MQDWDTRIKNLKNDIQIAREKFVIPFTKTQNKTPENSVKADENNTNQLNNPQENATNPQEKLYVNNNPTSSLDLINQKEEKDITVAQEAPTVDTNEVAASTEEAPTVDINEVVASTEEAPTVDINEVAASTEEAQTVDINEVVASTEEAPTVDINEVAASTEQVQGIDPEIQVKKTELELLEERGEDNLSDEEVDRMYELRLLRSQKNMNNELREQEQEELKKADEEIAHLKTLLKPKPKKLPKGFVE
ncbi:hypothetical protein OAQ56_03950 [Alphaproteobacteria bacterium]|nr:hypothetical protein [Alphaproteobacteria bacterium]